MPRDSVYITIVFLIFVTLIIFESLQQNFYITTFNLADDSSYNLLELFVSHSIRWVVWAVLSIPLFLLIKKNAQEEISPNFFTYLSIIILLVILDIVVIAFISILRNDVDLTGNTFLSYFEFYVYQKGPIFTLALGGLALFTHLFYYNRILKIEVNTLKALRPSSHDTIDEKPLPDDTKVISVKTGKRIKIIPLDEIVWVESDNYCVRIHTKDMRTHTLRSSMKKMEQLLPDSDFIRIHRSAIINILETQEVTLGHNPYVVLKQGTELEISQSRLPGLRKNISLNRLA